MELTQEQLKELLHYDPETGIFRWRKSTSNRVKPWDAAGSKNTAGYFILGICNNFCYAHRLAWLYMTGNHPKNFIDHIDGNKSNNSWVNLREATKKQNMENVELQKNNTSGFRGVTWDKKRKKWLAQIVHNRKHIYIGNFITAEEANFAAIAKRVELFTHYTGRDQVTQNDSIVI